MIGRQLVSLYGLTPQLIDWLQHTAVPWLQTHLGINASASSLSNIKQMFSENLGKTTDIAQLLLSQVTASSLAFLGWLASMLLIPVVTFYLSKGLGYFSGKNASFVATSKRRRDCSVGW